jgi:hypothetical protein
MLKQTFVIVVSRAGEKVIRGKGQEKRGVAKVIHYLRTVSASTDTQSEWKASLRHACTLPFHLFRSVSTRSLIPLPPSHSS